MELIYTDPNGKELGYILNANIDMEIGEDEKNSINDFEIEFKRQVGMERLNLEANCMFLIRSMVGLYRKSRQVQRRIALPQKGIRGVE